MKPKVWIPILFYLAAAYDGVLGLVFAVVPWGPYQMMGITPPNHWGYVQFPALLLLIFGWMFFRIARDPVANRGLIPFGIALKAAYCITVFWYWATSGVPGMWKPFAIIDLVMGVLFVAAWVRTEKIKR